MDGPQEDRGTPIWIWMDAVTNTFDFIPGEDSQFKFEINVPIGWKLSAHPDAGVILISTWKESLCAYDVYFYALSCQGGFRVRKQEEI